MNYFPQIKRVTPTYGDSPAEVETLTIVSIMGEPAIQITSGEVEDFIGLWSLDGDQISANEWDLATTEEFPELDIEDIADDWATGLSDCQVVES